MRRPEKTWIEKSPETETQKHDSNNKIKSEFDLPSLTSSAVFGLVKKLNADLKLEETYKFDEEAFVKNPSLRYNPWSTTILGIIIYFVEIISSLLLLFFYKTKIAVLF